MSEARIRAASAQVIGTHTAGGCGASGPASERKVGPAGPVSRSREPVDYRGVAANCSSGGIQNSPAVAFDVGDINERLVG